MADPGNTKLTTEPYTPPEPRYSFLDDYSEGAHPTLLQSLITSNMSQQTGYGNDSFSSAARTAIRRHLTSSSAHISTSSSTIATPGIFFVPTGTSANVISIASCLRPHEAVIAAATGHIITRETGAVEASGHKIINVPSPADGKLTPSSIKKALDENWHFPHMAKPRLVYISNATEIGTLYTRKELRAIKDLCEESGLLLFMDGARIGCALASQKNDCSLRDIVELTDIFWIGGTKNGALLGEAVVVKDPELARDFEFYVKQRGSLLAKGRAIGCQFAELFRNDDSEENEEEEENNGSSFKKTLYYELASKANENAQTLSTAVKEAGYTLQAETETNQVFAVLPRALIEKLQDRFVFYVWENLGDRAVVRLLTTWATDKYQIEEFCRMLKTPVGC